MSGKGIHQLLRSLLPEAQKSVLPREKLYAALTAFGGILAVVVLSRAAVGAAAAPYVVASMGAAAVLVFAVPQSPLAQPWPLLAGNIVSALVGTACQQLIAETALAAAVAVGLAIFVMHWMRCLHPPGGASALVAVIGGPAIHDLGYWYAVIPVGLNALTIFLAALLLNRLVPGRRYPALAKGAGESPAWAIGGPKFTNKDLEEALAETGMSLEISQADLNRVYESALLHSSKRRVGTVTCADIMTREVISFQFGTELEEAWHRLSALGIKGAPVVDPFNRVIGMITVADFMRHAAGTEGKTLAGRLQALIKRTPGHQSTKAEVVGQIMTEHPVLVAQTTHIVDLVPVFTTKGIHHLPVVDEEARLTGMITRSDVMRVLLAVRI